MNLISPEAEVLLNFFTYDQITSLSDHERVPILRDTISRLGADAVCSVHLTFATPLPAIAALQLTQAFPGKARLVTIEREEVIGSGVHRSNPAESHLYHPDSADYEIRFEGLAGECVAMTGDMLADGVNVGEAFSIYPMAATVTVILSGSAMDFRRLYEACGRRKGFLHPAVLEVAIDAIVEWKRVAPNLMLALDTASQ
jgi:hypothetical protein